MIHLNNSLISAKIIIVNNDSIRIKAKGASFLICPVLSRKIVGKFKNNNNNKKNKNNKNKRKKYSNSKIIKRIRGKRRKRRQRKRNKIIKRRKIIKMKAKVKTYYSIQKMIMMIKIIIKRIKITG